MICKSGNLPIVGKGILFRITSNWSHRMSYCISFCSADVSLLLCVGRRFFYLPEWHCPGRKKAARELLWQWMKKKAASELL